MEEIGESFVGRFDFGTTGTYGRAYVHNFGFEDAYGSNVLNAVEHVRDVSGSRSLEGFRKEKFGPSVAVAWGLNGQKMIDFFVYGSRPEDSCWNENSAVFSFVTQNGVLRPNASIVQIGCEDGCEIFNAESRYRRATNFVNYIRIPPMIPGLDQNYDFSTPEGRVLLIRKLRETVD